MIHPRCRSGRPGVATMSKWAAARDTSWPNMTARTATPTGKGTWANHETRIVEVIKKGSQRSHKF